MGADVAYEIHAQITDPATGQQERGTGTLRETAETLEQVHLALRNLRRQGLTAWAVGSDGQRIEEDYANRT